MEFIPPHIKINDTLILKEKDGGWAPVKSNLNLLEKRGYIVKGTIGEGRFSKVKQAFCDRTKETVAIKVIYKSLLHPADRRKFIPREIRILRTLQHPGLLDVIQVFESSQICYIVMEYAVNGDLTEFINYLGALCEPDARRLFKQLLLIVSYIHEKNICHRHITCDNILLDENFNVKLADFGFARKLPKHGLLETNCGSYVYTAPEVLDGEKYDGIAADVWSMGICLYCMLCGTLPYRDDDIDVLRNGMTEKLKFVKHVSKDCRELLRQIVNSDPNARPCISTILRDNWMCKPLKGPEASSVSVFDLDAGTENHKEIDLSAEHGFNCDMHGGDIKSSRVKDVLDSVADVHSTGASSVDISNITEIRKNSSASRIGVTGPAGRRLSLQHDNLDDGSTDIFNKLTAGGGGAFKSGKAAINKFKHAARVVTAVHRFRRGPLKTILNMPQEQAIQIIVENNIKNIERDKQSLHGCLSGINIKN